MTSSDVDDYVFEEDGVHIDGKKFKEFARKMHISNGTLNESQNQAQQIQCLYEATEWLKDHIDAMNLADKNIFIIIGASRTGKGTLLTALQGQKMKLFKRKDVTDELLKSQVA